jgi:hypothetical protein
MTAADLLARLGGVRRNGDGWLAFCPSHEGDGAGHTPSLSLKQDSDRVLVHCFGGCSPDAVLGALGLHARDLFCDEPKAPTNSTRKLGPIVATYDYTDERGALLYQVCRYAEPDKDFRQRRPDGHGGWIWKRDDGRRVVFGLPDLLDQADVFIVEGEKDVLALRALGLVATTNAGGARKWREEYTAQLNTAGCLRVVILPDNDLRGWQHGAEVARACQAAGLGVKLIDLPGLPDKGDVSDWIAGGGTRDRLAAIVSAAPPWTPEAPSAPPAPWARTLPDLIADLEATPDEPPLIVGFLMAGLITLLHGQPRDWKTIVALCVAIAATTGRALFGLARLAVTAPRRVLYVTEEDGRRRVVRRLQRLCAGLGIDPPDNLFVRAGTGFTLDEAEGVMSLMAFIKAEAITLLILDPLRSLSGCVDQGPKELRPLTLVLRQIMRETNCTILAVHHDSKPLAIGVDGRRRPQRASGGAVFSIADSPIGVDALPDGRRLLSPTAWKFGDDPPGIVLTIEDGDGWLRLVGQDADGATSAGEADLAGRILTYLVANPRTSGTTIQKTVKARKVDVLAALERLAEAGKIDGVQMGRSTLWFVIDRKGREPYGNHRNEPDSEADSMVPDAGTVS